MIWDDQGSTKLKVHTFEAGIKFQTILKNSLTSLYENLIETTKMN